MKIKELWGKAVNFTDNHQREIKLGLTIAGVVLTGISAAKAGIKAHEILEKQKEKISKLNDNADDMTDEEYAQAKKEITLDTVKCMTPAVLPPVIIGGATIWSAVSGYSSATKQIAALSAAYNISEKALTEYTEKAKEMLGDKKSQAVKDESNISTMQKAFNNGGQANILETGKGSVLFYDKITGTFFRSNINAIETAINRVVADWQQGAFDEDDEAPYSAFLDELGLPSDSTAARVFCFKMDPHTKRKEIRLRHSVGSVQYQDTMESGTVIDFFDAPEVCREYLKGYGLDD